MVSSPGHSELKKDLEDYGFGTTSIFYLYENMKVIKFKSPQSLFMGYISQNNYNIGLLDPLCPIEQTMDCLSAFILHSKNERKGCIFIDINENTAKCAEELGMPIVKIGHESSFDLENYSSECIEPKVRSAIRQVFKKGVVIEEYSIKSLEDYYLIESMNDVLNQWFMTRQTHKLMLSNEVNPFTSSDDKKYFIARIGNHVEAFLACSPVYARKGYYLQDLIRRPSALNGISEALVVTALEYLKKENYKFASLGMVPFSGLDVPGMNTDHRWLNRLFVRIFKKTNFPISFQNLYSFKLKFKPDLQEPHYAAVSSKRFSISHVIAISSLYGFQNIISNIRYRLNQWKMGINLPSPQAWMIKKDRVLLPPLDYLTFSNFYSRIKFTVWMIIINVSFFIYSSDIYGNIKPVSLSNFGFSYENFLTNKWFILFTSNFFHFNVIHLLSNMILLFIFGSILEFTSGSTLFILAYILGLEADVPNFLIVPILGLFNLNLSNATFTYTDVGASLGVMSVIGALVYLFRSSISLILITTIVTGLIITISFTSQFMGVDHIFAIVLGYLTALLYVSRNKSKEMFHKTNVEFLSTQNLTQSVSKTTTTVEGVYEPSVFQQLLGLEVERSYIYDRWLTLIIIEIDQLQYLLDVHETECVNYLKKEIVNIIFKQRPGLKNVQQLRKTDIFSIYKKERMAILLPETTIENGNLIAERIRSLVESHNFEFKGKTLKITISLGLNVAKGHSIEKQNFLSDAETALGKARRSGGNKVIAQYGLFDFSKVKDTHT